MGLSNFVNKSDGRRPQPPNLEILKLAKPAKKYKLQSCILGNCRLSTNQQSRTEESKRSQKKTKKQWQSSNSRFVSVQTSYGAGIHRHAAFICIAYTTERGGSKNLTHSVNTESNIHKTDVFIQILVAVFCLLPIAFWELLKPNMSLVV